MERVGKDGVITIQDGKTLANELDVIGLYLTIICGRQHGADV
jgi:hypothetical protein